MRNVICHYHIYKNSGTSFDYILEDNYKERHICFDGPFPFCSIDQRELEHIVRRHKNVIAFSSHQIHLPTPVSLDLNILPVVFVRHPLLRIESIYRFKKKINDETEISNFAQQNTFDQWLKKCFESTTQITHVSNSQTRLLGGVYGDKSLKKRHQFKMEYDIEQACRNISTVPLLARTERFDEDVANFCDVLKTHSIDFNFTKGVIKNSTNKNLMLPVNERVNNLLENLPTEISVKLTEANHQDLRLYQLANNILD